MRLKKNDIYGERWEKYYRESFKNLNHWIKKVIQDGGLHSFEGDGRFIQEHLKTYIILLWPNYFWYISSHLTLKLMIWDNVYYLKKGILWQCKMFMIPCTTSSALSHLSVRINGCSSSLRLFRSWIPRGWRKHNNCIY